MAKIYRLSVAEILVRNRDDPTESIYENARRISIELDFNLDICGQYLEAKRQGFDSRSAYIDHLFAYHIKKLKKRDEVGIVKRGIEQRIFEKRMVLCGRLRNIADNPFNEARQNHNRYLLHTLLEILSEKDRRFIEDIHFLGKNLSKIGRELGISREWARQKYKRILNRLRRIAAAKQLELQEYTA